jgi:PQQ-dependent dehydrogenase (methanol/ethanol family)
LHVDDRHQEILMSTRHIFGVLAAAALATACAPNAQVKTEWPSYNNTLTSERFSTLTAIDTSNAGKLAVVCTFDTKEMTAFQSGLVQVNGALLATTEHDTLSLDPNTCKLNWRAHEDFPNSYLGAQRGVAVADGRVFRGARNGHVYAYDEKTGARLWDTTVSDMQKGESTPSAPITWNGLVFIGSAGGDNRGVKGRMYALDAATGKIVWEYYLAPKAPGDAERGPQGKGSVSASTWQNAPGVEITGGGTWTSYSLDPAKGEIYVPGGNPGPDFIKGLRKGANLYAGSVVVLDARTGDYKRHFSIVPEDFHDYDVSSPPALFASKNGTRIMALTPKDGFLYAYDLDSGRRLYRLPMTTQFNTDTPMSAKGVRFCPGTQGGAEWNGPAYDRAHDAVLTGQVDWCSTVHIDNDAKTKAVPSAQPWTGASKDGFGISDPQAKWAGWLTSVDAVSGKQRWRFKAPNPVMAGVTPTAGNVVFFGDMGGNFFALNSETGAKLGQWDLGGAVAGGVITYDAGSGQRVAVSTGMTSNIWPTPKVTAKIVVLGLK